MFTVKDGDNPVILAKIVLKKNVQLDCLKDKL